MIIDAMKLGERATMVNLGFLPFLPAINFQDTFDNFLLDRGKRLQRICFENSSKKFSKEGIVTYR